MKKKKLSPQKYAQLLISLTEGKEKKEIDKILKSFAAFLRDNLALSLLPRITENYEKIILAKDGKAKLEIQSAYKLSAENKKNLIKLAKKYFNEDKLETETTVDENLKGGFILRSENRIVDMSLNNLLDRLEKEIKA